MSPVTLRNFPQQRIKVGIFKQREKKATPCHCMELNDVNNDNDAHSNDIHQNQPVGIISKAFFAQEVRNSIVTASAYTKIGR